MPKPRARYSLVKFTLPFDSGGGEIRTHETLAGLPVFKTGAFDHSATPPSARSYLPSVLAANSTDFLGFPITARADEPRREDSRLIRLTGILTESKNKHDVEEFEKASDEREICRQ